MIPPIPAQGRRLLHSYVRHGGGATGQHHPAAQWLNKTTVRLLNKYLRERPVTDTVQTRFGAVFAVDTSDVIQRYLYLFGMWEPHLTHWMQERLSPGDTFIDIGANIGYFSVLASRQVGPRGQVVSIEASPRFHEMLRQNLRANECTNVRSVNTAVSDTAGVLTFYLEDAGNLGATTIVRPTRAAQQTFEMSAQSLPQILTEQEIRGARLIKIDVEGAEAAVVRGLTSTLDRLRPDVELVIEVGPERLARQGDSVHDVIDPLLRCGFHVYRLDNRYEPGSYPQALGAPLLPTRWRKPVTDNCDLVFSRIDAERLGRPR
ncbi:FkbM family methyltransferase [Streptomyces sp. NPDC014864]|uniref:FkbM family methyltransferase n=1 Tax=Streptomyces sp. NPDC014864 TaxID=3364924 RepID=UPI003701F88E